MKNPPDHTQPSADEFKATARREFEFLLDEFGFREQPIPTNGAPENPVAVWFTSETTRVVVEGINWGSTARVAIGRAVAAEQFENFDLLDLATARSADRRAFDESRGNQLKQLATLAAILHDNGRDVLEGDFSVFPDLRAVVARRAAERRKPPVTGRPKLPG
jgi:hypothetical protein